MSRWIPVSERLPENEVLLISNNAPDKSLYLLVVGYPVEGGFQASECTEPLDWEPTHWMPLPEPPE